MNDLVNAGGQELHKFEDGALSIDVRFFAEEHWMTQQQMADMYGCNVQNVGKHIKKLLEDGEIDDSVISILEHTASDGKVYKTNHYNTDAVIAVGYRVNSKRAVAFRKWSRAVIKQKAKEEVSQQIVLPNFSRRQLLEMLLENEKEKEAKNAIISQRDQTIEAMRPNAELGEKVVDTFGTDSVAMVGKYLGIGERELFKFLRDNHVLMRNNIPYQKHMVAGRFEVKKVIYEANGVTRTYEQTRVTPKGIQFIQQLWNQRKREALALEHQPIQARLEEIPAVPALSSDVVARQALTSARKLLDDDGVTI